MTELTDKEQIELFKKWWRQYGKSIVLALILGVGIGFSWRFWHQHQTNRAISASIMFDQLQTAVVNNQIDTSKTLVKELMQDYKKTPYAAMAALLDASLQVKANHNADALTQLRWVIANSKDNGIKQIAEVRAARILFSEQQPEAARELLKNIRDPALKALIEE